jgi:hypothetical protein
MEEQNVDGGGSRKGSFGRRNEIQSLDAMKEV